ncbi:hypothetical protein [Bhargavaea beijingensis]|uniref:hypothetical protein n=1 Tax=Bhargavaea beijingensis TaxID=426756 RepID=UPI002224CB7E|nr:hypothetical protein [Bhargavaea beijingensis]MCW1928315.1 hypothetical protein [Bhargavaea beijingensis]
MNDETGRANDETGSLNDETGRANDETGRRNDETSSEAAEMGGSVGGTMAWVPGSETKVAGWMGRVATLEQAKGLVG